MDDKTIEQTVTAPEETGSTETQENTSKENQAETKTFSQEDVDRIIRNRLTQVERKYDGVNIEEYHNLKEEQTKQQKAQLMKKEKFEELLQQQKHEADAKIDTLQSELHKIKIDGELINAASKHKAVNPEHVVSLLKNNVRLSEAGQVEVLDSDGQVRYDTTTATPVTVDQAVEEFLQANTYFRSAQPGGAGSNGNNTHSSSRELDITKLDMSNPDDRAKYKEWRKSNIA